MSDIMSLVCKENNKGPRTVPCVTPDTTGAKSDLKVRRMQRSGTEEIRTQIQPSKPKREITYITTSQNTKENIWLTELAAISQKVATQ